MGTGITRENNNNSIAMEDLMSYWHNYVIVLVCPDQGNKPMSYPKGGERVAN